MNRKALWLVPTLLVLGVAVRQTRVAANQIWLTGQKYADSYYLPPPDWLPVLALHYDAALADLIWIRSLLYFGEELVHRGEVRYLYQHADAMIALDPKFRAVYHWIAVAALYR